MGKLPYFAKKKEKEKKKKKDMDFSTLTDGKALRAIMEKLTHNNYEQIHNIFSL